MNDISNITLDDALTIQEGIRNDLKHINNSTCYYLTFTFKNAYLRTNEENYPERLNEVRKCLDISFRSCRGKERKQVRPRERVFFLKDEVGRKNNYHIHALVDLYYLSKRYFPNGFFLKQVSNYWSGPTFKIHKDKELKELEQQEQAEPKVGWFNVSRPRYNSKTMKNNRLTLFNYQTKTVKPIYDDDSNYLGEGIISNCQYHASYGLYNSLDKLHRRYGTENRYIKRKSDALIHI